MISADTPLQTPVSLTGGTKRVARLWRTEQTGWLLWTRRIGVVLLMPLMWAVSLLFYAAVLGFGMVPFIAWGIYTLNRRHHIHATRRAMLAANAPQNAL
jgi:hypothetical protein